MITIRKAYLNPNDSTQIVLEIIQPGEHILDKGRFCHHMLDVDRLNGLSIDELAGMKLPGKIVVHEKIVEDPKSTYALALSASSEGITFGEVYDKQTSEFQGFLARYRNYVNDDRDDVYLDRNRYEINRVTKTAEQWAKEGMNIASSTKSKLEAA